MVEMIVSEGISVKDFFLNEVPKFFAEGVKEVKVEGMEGTEFTLQFNITGEAGGVYCLKIRNGKELEVVEGGIEIPMIEVELAEPDWRDSITGKVPGSIDVFMSPERAASRQQYDVVAGLKGKMISEMKKPDGGIFKTVMKFNGADKPWVTLKSSLEDATAMMKGEADGQALFMEGNLQFEGDLAFLMQLQALIIA
jgi:putative sterol carrier protein